MNWYEKIGMAVIVIPLIILLIAILSVFPVWWAWNTFMPAIFGLPTINGWQAFALTILGGILGTRSISTGSGK